MVVRGGGMKSLRDGDAKMVIAGVVVVGEGGGVDDGICSEEGDREGVNEERRQRPLTAHWQPGADCLTASVSHYRTKQFPWPNNMLPTTTTATATSPTTANTILLHPFFPPSQFHPPPPPHTPSPNKKKKKKSHSICCPFGVASLASERAGGEGWSMILYRTHKRKVSPGRY